MDRREAVGQLKCMYQILDSDFELARRQGLATPSPYALRNCIRTWFALVEGMTYQLRLVAYTSLHKTPLLSDEDYEMLGEIKQALGELPHHATMPHAGFAKTLKHALHVYPKVHGAQFKPDLGGKGWAAMRNSIKLRNRLAHPKTPADLEVSQEEDQQMGIAMQWWQSNFLALLQACHSADQFYTQDTL